MRRDYSTNICTTSASSTAIDANNFFQSNGGTHRSLTVTHKEVQAFKDEKTPWSDGHYATRKDYKPNSCPTNMTSLSIGRNSVSAFNDGIYKVITSKLSLVSVLKREKSAFADGQEIVQVDCNLNIVSSYT
ncbi:hypothetical protein GCM10027035_29080 [Emticicia sediminis]